MHWIHTALRLGRSVLDGEQHQIVPGFWWTGRLAQLVSVQSVLLGYPIPSMSQMHAVELDRMWPELKRVVV